MATIIVTVATPYILDKLKLDNSLYLNIKLYK
jgi:hypothetical protein